MLQFNNASRCSYKMYVVDKSILENAKNYFNLGTRKMSLSNFLSATCVYTFPGLELMPELENVQRLSTRLFEEDALQDTCMVEDPYILSKKALQLLIEIEKSNIYQDIENFDSDSYNCDDNTYKERYNKFTKDLILGLKLLTLDDTSDFNFVDTWLSEYNIFNLLYIFKTIDFTKFSLLLMWG